MRKQQTFNSLDVLYIELTNKCNFECIHCGNEEDKAQNLDFNLTKRLLEEFNSLEGKKLILTGGEPLLHPRLEDILKLANSHNYNTKLSTNASLLNKPTFNFIFNYPLGFRLSLDGTKKIHNQIRNNDSYDNLIQAMKRISKEKKQIIIRTTVMKKNKDIISDMLHELDRLTKEEGINIYSNNIWPVRNIGKSEKNLMLTPKEYKKFLRDLNNKTRNLKPSFRIIIGPTFGLESEFEGGPIQSNQIYKCDILNTSLHIAYNGDIYPCSFVHHSLGNIKKDSIKAVFNLEETKKFRKKFLDKKNHDCDQCKSYETCKAGCVAETYKDLFNECKIKDIYCFKGEL